MRRRLAVIILVIASTFIILVALIFAYHSNNSKTQTNQTTNITSPQSPSFDESTLTNVGVTSQQLSNLEQALEQYLVSQNKTPSQVSFNSVARQPTNPNATTPFSELTFVVQLDGKATYWAKLDSFSLSEIRLYLYSLDGGKLLYDSQNIGGS